MSKTRTRPASGVRGRSAVKDAGAGELRNARVARYLPAAICVFLALVTVVAFSGVLANSFVQFDDTVYISENPNVLLGPSVRALKWAFNISYSGNWHPLTWISHMLDCRIFGSDPRGHHAVNVLLHIANALLLFLLLRRMTRSVWQSASVAALFAIHPLHVESVAWAAERKDVLSTLFWLLTIGAYARYADSPNWRRYSAVVLFFALGLMSKPMLVMLPLTLLLMDYWPLRRMSVLGGNHAVGKLVLEKTPLFALSAASSVITFIAQQRGKAVSPLELIPLAVRIENAVVSYASYIMKMFWPTRLAVLYPHPCKLLPAWQVIGAALLFALITYLVVVARARRPYLLFGWTWYVVTLLPVIGLVQVGCQAMADRYTYIPLIGIFVMIAWGVSESVGVWGCGGVGERTSRTRPLALAVCAVCALILVLLVAQTRKQVGYWRDNLTLFRHTVECTKDNYAIHNSLGLALFEEGRVDEAIQEYLKSLEISPNYISARLDLGIALCDLGKTSDAIAQFEEAIRIKPDYADSYYNMGRAYEGAGDFRLAAEQYIRALELDPDHVQANINVGNMLAARKQYDEAIRHFRTALSVNPLQIEAHVDLANVLHATGDSDGAIREYEEVIRINPGYGVAHGNLAIVLYYQGNFAEAWREIRLAENYGETPNPAFLRALAGKMPEPSR